MEDTEKAVLEPSKVKVKLKADNVDICNHPIFQSGINLYYDSASVIICAIGSEYNSYCSNVARTFLIDANATQSKAFRVLLKAQEAAIGALKAGSKVSMPYEAALAVVEKDCPELLPKNIPEVATMISSKALKNVAYLFNEEEVNLKLKQSSAALLSKSTLRSDNQEMSKEELRTKAASNRTCSPGK
ncbi:hypothetical protein MKW94_026588 [Papaver nudicaule]|uniref:FACT complex subunit n=1 Tax=Papaver nudicaule TaxID=74823 RepID=A0AA41W327_PAPNU|nr:hypothetical protein [Papaver nudicaule]